MLTNPSLIFFYVYVSSMSLDLKPKVLHTNFLNVSLSCVTVYAVEFDLLLNVCIYQRCNLDLGWAYSHLIKTILRLFNLCLNACAHFRPFTHISVNNSSHCFIINQRYETTKCTESLARAEENDSVNSDARF